MPQPAFIEPMLAKLVDKLPEGPQWEYELKLDGYRLEAIKSGDKAHLYSRRGNDFTKKFARIAASVCKLKADSVVLDGEAVVTDPQGRSLPGTLAEIIAAVKQHELEGVIAKRLDSKYLAGRRSEHWLKMPLKPKQEFVIGGFRLEGKRLELLLVGYYEKGKLLFTGKINQGLNPANRAALLKGLDYFRTKKCQFANLPSTKSGHWGEGVTAEDMESYVWVRPEVVAEIKFVECFAASRICDAAK